MHCKSLNCYRIVEINSEIEPQEKYHGIDAISLPEKCQSRIHCPTNRWAQNQLPLKRVQEMTPKNILILSNSWKTEIARR